MADNIDVTPGTGKTIAADDIGGVLYQRAKVTFGVDGVAADVSAANPLPVTVAQETATAVTDGSTAVPQNTATDIFTATGTATGKTMRNRGPADATFKIGGAASGAGTERVLLVGEEKTFAYRADVRISAWCSVSGGTTIEWESWS